MCPRLEDLDQLDEKMSWRSLSRAVLYDAVHQPPPVPPLGSVHRTGIGRGRRRRSSPGSRLLGAAGVKTQMCRTQATGPGRPPGARAPDARRSEVPPALAAARSSYRPAAKAHARIAELLPLHPRTDPPCSHRLRVALDGTSSPSQPCQRAAKGLPSIAWTRHLTLARGLKATNRLLLPAPATKQEPPTEETTPDLVMLPPRPPPRGF